MKILIFSDLHLHSWSSFNLNKASELSRRLKEQENILEQITVLVEERKVNSVEIIGDIFHKVGEIPVICLNIFDRFLSTLEDLEVPVNITTGNHDLSVRESPKYVHNATNIFSKYQSIVLKEPKIKRIGYSEAIDYDEVKGYDLLLLHKTPAGAIYNNYTFTDGVDWRRLAKNNRLVFFGHIHDRQTLSSNCIVVGSPMHLTFGDTGDRGCYIVDTDTWNVEFIKLKYPEFRNVETIEDVKDDYNYYKVKNAQGKTDKTNVISVSVPDFFEERLKSTTFEGIVDEWLQINKQPETYKEIIKPLLTEKFRFGQDVFNGKLVSVSIKDFMSIEDITYKVKPGFILVKGQNEGFSSNGSGKTALFESIYYALFGETTKGLTGDDVIRRGQKDTVVELSLVNDKGLYIIKRSRKYGVTLILPDEEESSFTGLRETDKQKALESFLGFDKNIFLTSCYFSQENLVMLTSMSDTEKTNAITSLLGFEVYDDLYNAVFVKIKHFETEINLKEQEIVTLSIAKQKWITSIKYIEDRIKVIEAEIIKYQTMLVGFTNDVNKVKLEEVSILVIEFVDYEVILKESYELQTIFERQLEGVVAMRDATNEQLTKAKVNESSLLSKLDTLHNLINQVKYDLQNLSAIKLGERCNKCGATISEDNVTIFIEEKRNLLKDYAIKEEELKAEINGLEIQSKSIKSIISDYDDNKVSITIKLNKVKQDIKDVLKEKDEYQVRLQKQERSKVELEHKVKLLNNDIEECRKSIKKLDLEQISCTDENIQHTRELNKCLEEEKELNWLINKFNKGIEVLEFWKNAFSPKGIRALLIDRFCNEMNSNVNDYLSSISSGFMSLSMTPTSVLKSGEERNKLGLDIFMQDIGVKYQSLSGGEKRRVDIALMLGLNKWVQEHFRLKTGLLGFMILDETFSFLDASAEESIGSLLYQEGFKKAIFVVSHTDELQNYTNCQWVVNKKDGISKLEVSID